MAEKQVFEGAGFRTGANSSDQKLIFKMEEAGLSAKEIAVELKINLTTVESFLDFGATNFQAGKKQENLSDEELAELEEAEEEAEAELADAKDSLEVAEGKLETANAAVVKETGEKEIAVKAASDAEEKTAAVEDRLKAAEAKLKAAEAKLKAAEDKK